MPSSLLEYVAEGSTDVVASILVVRALVRFLASRQIFRARGSAPLHRLVCFGMRRRVAWPRSMPRSAAEAAPWTGNSAARKAARRREEKPRSVVTKVVFGETVNPACRRPRST